MTARARWVFALMCAIAPVPIASTQSSVPIRELGPVEAASSEPFRNIFGVREVQAGKLVVNDGVRRQLVLLDDRLQLERVLLDSASSGDRSYGPRASPTIPYLGDSTLFVDGAALTLLVLDGNGKVVRVMSAPSARDLRMLAYATSATDAQGNLIYVGSVGGASYAIVGPGIKPTTIALADSAPLLRANFETRTIDTVGRLRRQAAVHTNSVQLGNGMMQVTKVLNPVTNIDEWAVLSDGSIAFIRGHDYHVDWVMPNGERRATPKLPFDWKALTERDKLALMDSARNAEEGAFAATKLAAKDRASMRGEASVGEARSMDPTIEFVPLKEMGDYFPAIRYGAARTDLDRQLWILPTTSAQSKDGELIYDVVNASGALTHRVRIPNNRSIAGFGKNGVVYLMFRDDAGVWHLERRHTRATIKD